MGIGKFFFIETEIGAKILSIWPAVHCIGRFFALEKLVTQLSRDYVNWYLRSVARRVRLKG